jgi:hypothetical protein
MIEPVICAWTIRAVHPGEDQEGQYQFGGIVKADVEQPAEGLPARSASWSVARRSQSEDHDGGGTDKEDPAGRRVGVSKM